MSCDILHRGSHGCFVLDTLQACSVVVPSHRARGEQEGGVVVRVYVQSMLVTVQFVDEGVPIS